MIKNIIYSFAEFHNYIETNCTKNSIFRGVNNVNFSLIPKIGRDIYTRNFSSKRTELIENLQDLEERTIVSFIKMSVPYMDLRETKSWDRWTIGQHFGIPTRFLDWTENPLIAAYFAVEGGIDHDSVVYITDRGQFNSNAEDSDDPLSIADEIVLYAPSYIDGRVIAQKGVFTVHKNPTLPLNETEISGSKCNVQCLIIKKECKSQFMKTLDRYGINRSFIYPGLDGLAAYLDNTAQNL
ncbi:FRG domain-containing protein [Pelosinus propionicus]|uniref:FRG domain-containing protein n=1 Tax=Pelosinus propionicus DSM 13327 TaxID=1123291 RepID=A0A1I4P7R6_9FIRM|nr:FRG domain-containing protein [Pelosinus propionicus]SFM23848.1 FRG domain-containing protein [Pelosinus propionicus DSM 13327]